MLNNILSGIQHRLNKALGHQPPAAPDPVPVINLEGDREIEWTYVSVRIGRYANEKSRVLDFGCGIGALSSAAASIGARVVSIDLMPQQFPDRYPNIEFRQMDVLSLNEESERFDLILNCSTLEHVGLAGRYNSKRNPDGDIHSMRKLRRLLARGGHMLFVLPIGQDAVFNPLHRVYGEKRLPQVLAGFTEVESQFWHKDHRNIWLPCSKETALQEPGSDHYYCIGCFVLQGEG